MPQELTSKLHKIKLVITGSDEPNNGRMLWVAELYINNIDVTGKYFGSWDRLNENLDNYNMDSPDGKFVFIPAEGGGFLIDTTSLIKYPLAYKALSTIKFQKNEFRGNLLIITYDDETIEIDLDNIK